MFIKFSSYPFKLQDAGLQQQIFDPLRKKYVALTPEEWVRQHWVHYLIDDCGYAKGRMASEVSLDVNGQLQRADLAYFDRDGQAQLIVECKAPEVKITEKTLKQILRYNLPLKARFFILSNGQMHYGFKINDSGKFEELEEMPEAASMNV